MAKYLVNTPILYGGRDAATGRILEVQYLIGDIADFDDAIAAPLLERGSITLKVDGNSNGR